MLTAPVVPPSSLVLGLEQSTRCFVFHVHCSHLGGKVCTGHPDPKASDMLLVGTCWWCWGEHWEKFGAAWGVQLSRGLSYLQQCRAGPCSPGSSRLGGKRCWSAAGGSPACLPPRRCTDKEETCNYTSERSEKLVITKVRGEKQELGVPFRKGVCVGGCRAAVGKRFLMWDRAWIGRGCK